MDESTLSRRGFIGSMLGVFAGTQLDWIARRAFGQPIAQPKHVLTDYRSILLLGNGRAIQGPGVIEVTRGGLQFADIDCRCSMRVNALSVLYKGVRLTNWSAFTSGPQLVCSGDKLRIHYAPYFYFPDGTVVDVGDGSYPELLEKYIKEVQRGKS